MGIDGLLAFLRELCPEIVQHTKLSDFKGYRIALDLPVLCYQKKSDAISKLATKLDLVYEDIDYHYCTMFMIKKILGILENILYAGAIPVPVFDGTAPKLKQRTKANRKKKSDNKKDNIEHLRRILRGLLGNTGNRSHEYNKDGTPNTEFVGFETKVSNLNNSNEPYHLTEFDIAFLRKYEKKRRPVQTIDDLKKILLAEIKQWVVITSHDYLILGTIFSTLGIPHVYAQSEAEQTCAQMCKMKDVMAVFTVDSDCLVYGCPIMINSITLATGIRVRGQPIVQCYLFSNVLSVLGLTHSQFIDMCIMFGTDFNDNCDGYGPVKNYQLIKHYGSIKNIEAAREQLQLKILTADKMHSAEKLCLTYDTTILNYDEVRCFFTNPITYDIKALQIRVLPNQQEHAFDMLAKIMTVDNFRQIADICKKLLELLIIANKGCKHEPIQ